MNFKTIDFELTSACNAACPLCPRTEFFNKSLNDFLDKDIVLDVVKSLPDKHWWFNFKGDLGDCINHKELLLIIERIFSIRKNRGGFQVDLFTNGGTRHISFWQELGQMSKLINNTEDCNMKTYFAIDGLEDTNHLYRVNVKYNKLMNNVKNYISNGGRAGWKYITFNHNEHQINEAKELSKILGFEDFTVRKSWRNITSTFKNIKQSKKYTYKKDQVKKHLNNLNVAKKPLNKIEEEKDFTNEINCFYLHEESIFIGSDATVWPCCAFYDSYRKKHETFMSTISNYPKNFNNLNYHKINEIFESEFFGTISKRWKKSKDNKLFSKECVRFCSQKGAMAPIDKLLI